MMMEKQSESRNCTVPYTLALRGIEMPKQSVSPALCLLSSSAFHELFRVNQSHWDPVTGALDHS